MSEKREEAYLLLLFILLLEPVFCRTFLVMGATCNYIKQMTIFQINILADLFVANGK